MPIKNIPSIQNRIRLSIVIYSALFILAISIATAFYIAERSKAQLFKDTKQLAATIASLSLPHMENEEGNKPLFSQLEQLSSLSLLRHIHIYRMNNDDELVSFTSHHYRSAKEYIGNPNDIKDVQAFITPKNSANGVELIVPIDTHSKTYGYVYIQVRNEQYYQLVNTLVIAIVVIQLLTFIISYYIAARIAKRVVAPLESMTSATQYIIQHKDFAHPYPNMPYQEFDILARNMSLLCNRVSKHIDKLIEAEQTGKILNLALEEKVETRTNALKESNQELLSTLEKLHEFQGQLVEEKKMASLGDMVAGVAHEVNTPIGLGVTASTLLADKLDDIKSAFEDKSLKSSQLKKFLHEGQENIDIICRNLTRAADLISSFKKVAVDQSSEDLQQFNIYDLIQEVILTLAPKLDKTHVVIKIDCPKNLVIRSKPGPINQIFINLIINSLIHGFEGKDNGSIDINVLSLSNQLSIQYLDNGIGIAPSIEKRIFEPFATTKRGTGGSGLGLHLVYNLVTQALGGSISLDNNSNQGVNFEICFPIS